MTIVIINGIVCMMLESFKVRGFRGFATEARLEISEQGCTYVRGRVGSGKTDMCLALMDLHRTLADIPERSCLVPDVGFLNGHEGTDHAEFTYVFRDGDSEVCYSYSRVDPLTMVRESLLVNGDMVFLRDGEGGQSDFSNLPEQVVAGPGLRSIGNGPFSVLRFLDRNTLYARDTPIRSLCGFAEGMRYHHPGTSDDWERAIVRNGLTEGFRLFLEEVTGTVLDLVPIDLGIMPPSLAVRISETLLPFKPVASEGTKALAQLYSDMHRGAEAGLLCVDGLDSFLDDESLRLVLSRLSESNIPQTVVTQRTGSVY